MALTLIAEDGSGKPDANSYAAVADGDAYHDGHLYAADWTGASTATKEKALVMATRLIDAHYAFRGYRAHTTQALQWPREQARDDDQLRSVTFLTVSAREAFFPKDAVPAMLRDATIETARALIKSDRTEDPEGEGLATMALTGSLSLTFDKKDRAPVIPHVAQAMLAKLGEYTRGRAGVVRVIRG